MSCFTSWQLSDLVDVRGHGAGQGQELNLLPGKNNQELVLGRFALANEAPVSNSQVPSGFFLATSSKWEVPKWGRGILRIAMTGEPR